jgi:hypothetical protein
MELLMKRGGEEVRLGVKSGDLELANAKPNRYSRYP